MALGSLGQVRKCMIIFILPPHLAALTEEAQEDMEAGNPAE